MPNSGFVDEQPEAPPVSLLTRRVEIVGVAAILLLALGVRAVNLHNEAAWYDEIVTISLLDSPTLSDFLSRCQELTPVPWFNVYEVTEYFWANVVGSSVTSIRVLSVLYGLGSLIALYVFTRSVMNARAALIALGWTAFMPWHIYFSQEIRFYSLVSLLSILSMHSLVHVTRGRSPKWFVLNCALNLLLVWTHIATIFLPIAQGVFLLLVWSRNRATLAVWAVVNGTVVLHAYASQPAFNPENLDKLVGWIPTPGIAGDAPSVASYLRVVAGHSFGVNDIRPFTDWGEALHPAYPLLKWLLTLTALAVTGIAIYRLFRVRVGIGEQETSGLGGRQKVMLLALWFFVPPLCAFVGSYVVRPMFVERYVIYAAYPAYMLIGYGLSLNRLVWIPAAALALPVAMYATFQFPGPYRVPFDRIVETVEANSGEDDVVLTENQVIYTGSKFYAQDSNVTVLNPAASSEMLNGASPGYFWVLLINPDQDSAGSRTEELRARGTVSGLWKVDALRAAYVWRWRPGADDEATP